MAAARVTEVWFRSKLNVECWLIIKLSSTRTGDLLKYDELTEPEIITIYHLTETDTQIPSLASYGCGPDQ